MTAIQIANRLFEKLPEKYQNNPQIITDPLETSKKYRWHADKHNMIRWIVYQERSVITGKVDGKDIQYGEYSNQEPELIQALIQLLDELYKGEVDE